MATIDCGDIGTLRVMVTSCFCYWKYWHRLVGTDHGPETYAALQLLLFVNVWAIEKATNTARDSGTLRV